MVNSNPVLLARHEVFFQEIIIDGPLGKVKYRTLRVGFQFIGSSHMYSFLWVIDAPDTKEEYLTYIDHIIKA